MSSWTHINGTITVRGITKQGIIKGFNLRKNISDFAYDDFCNNYKNFDYEIQRNKDGSIERLVKNYEKQLISILDAIPTPSGSEGGTEYCIGTYPKRFARWKFGNWEGTRRINTKKERLVSQMHEEDNDEKDIEDIWETSIGDDAIICLYGDLRDRTYEETKQELVAYIKELNKYFEIDDIKIHIGFNHECTSYCTYELDDKWNEFLKFDVTDITYTYKKRLLHHDFKEKIKRKKYIQIESLKDGA